MRKLIALREHRYGDKLHKEGDAYEAEDKWANLLTRIRKAKYADEGETEPKPEAAKKPVEAAPKPKDGRLNRRDMRAKS